MNEKNPRLIQSVQRAIEIMDCFDSLNMQLTLSEISEKVNLNISTAHGILNTLVAYSYIDKNPDNGRYRLGMKFLSKGNLVSENLDLREIGHQYLKTITTKYMETSHLCLYQQGEIYCIDKVESPQGFLIMSSKIGSKLPMHATASGKAILANLPEEELKKLLSKYKLTKLTEKTIIDIQEITEALKTIRNQGFAIEEEEAELGAFSIAAPIRNHKSRIIGTISLSGPVVRIKGSEEQISKDLMELASTISNEFGYHKK